MLRLGPFCNGEGGRGLKKIQIGEKLHRAEKASFLSRISKMISPLVIFNVAASNKSEVEL